MNSSKKHEWILCPSKRFPGQFYYFNVVNGDTAWSSNEAETRLKNPPIQKIDKHHRYHEPSSPPVHNTLSIFKLPDQQYIRRETFSFPKKVITSNDYTQNLTSSNVQVIPESNIAFPQSNNGVHRSANTVHQSNNTVRQSANVPLSTNFGLQSTFLQSLSQVFGQAVFPKPLIQVPSAIGSNKTSPQVLMILMNQNDSSQSNNEPANVEVIAPALSVQNITEPRRDLFVQTSNVPLSQRFANYKSTGSSFNDRNKFDSTPLNKYGPVSPVSLDKHSSIESCGLSKLNLTNIKSRTEPPICEPVFNLTMRQMPDETITRCKSMGNCPNLTSKMSNVRQKITFDSTRKPMPNKNISVYPKNPSVQSNIFAPNSSQSNVFASTSTQTNLFSLSTSEENIFTPSIPKTNIVAPGLSNVNVFKALNSKTDNYKVKECFPEIQDFVQKQKKLEPIIFNQTSVKENPTVNHTTELICKKSTDQNEPLNEAIEKVQPHVENCKEKSPFAVGEKTENQTINENLTLKNLDHNDLRLLLVAKRRKSVGLERQKETIKGKIIKTTRQESNPTPVVKKKVTFNLEPESYYDIETRLSDGERSNTVEDNKETEEEEERDDSWYAVPDTDVMLEELLLLEEFVTSDPKCKLLIPSVVMSDIHAISRRECMSEHQVALARQSLRRLGTPLPYVIVQESHRNDKSVNVSKVDSIITCCLEVMEQNARVILITNNESLQTKAKSYKINFYTIEQIKDSALKKPNFDIKKIKICVPNERTSVVTTHVFKNKLFDDVTESYFTSNASKHSNEEPASSNRGITENKKLVLRQNLQCLNGDEKKRIETQEEMQKSQKTNSTTLEKRNVPHSEDTVSFFFKNKTLNKELKNRKESESETEHKTVSYYFENEVKDTDISNSSVFQLVNDKLKKTKNEKRLQDIKLKSKKLLRPSKFDTDNNKQVSNKTQPSSSLIEIDGIEKLETFKPDVVQNQSIIGKRFKLNTAPRNSIFGGIIKSNVSQNPSTFEKRKYENTEVHLKDSGSENAKSRTEHVTIRNSDFENGICEHEVQLNSFMYSSDKSTEEEQLKTSIFETDKYRNRRDQSNRSIFQMEKCKNNDTQTGSIFEIGDEDEAMLPVENNNEVVIEDYLKMFCIKNQLMEEIIKVKKEELICSFVQVMEYCLTDVLLESIAIQKSMPAPYTLFKALQCTVKVYDSHTTIGKTVHTLCTLLYDYNSEIKKHVKTKDLMKCFGCGLLLIRYLKGITKATDSLTDAEDIINTILKNIEDTNPDFEVPAKTPALCCSESPCNEHTEKKTFVKHRSDVISYMKKHFPAWANFDETLEDEKSKSSWGKHYEDNKIVRTRGKDLSSIKIHKSNTIIMSDTTKEDNTQENIKTIDRNIALKSNTREKDIDLQNQTIENDNNNETELTSEAMIVKELPDARTITNNSTLNQPFAGRKLTRIIDNKPKIVQQKDNIQVSKSIENSIKSVERKTEPKIIRLLSNLNSTKEQIVNKTVTDNDKPLFDIDFKTHGHTFDTGERTGPKVIRNVQMIEEFEDKIKYQRTCVDLDEDYSEMSNSDKHDNKDYISTNINAADNEDKTYFETINDESNSKDQPNYLRSTNDSALPIKQTKSNMKTQTYFTEGSCVTNTDIHSMSLDNCVANNIYTRNNNVKNFVKDENSASNYSPMNDNNIISDHVTCLRNKDSSEAHEEFHTPFSGNDYIHFENNNYPYEKNDNLRVANDTCFGRNDKCNVGKDNFYKIYDNCYEVNDRKDDDYNVHKDEITHDSGFKDESMQAYTLVRSFLHELSESLLLTHKFIEESIKELRNDTLSDNNKTMLHWKANALHAKMIVIIDRLKRIIQRERNDSNKLLSLLSGAGARAANDPRAIGYRHVVEKCLEQAQILEKPLKTLISVTSSDVEPVSWTSGSFNNTSNVRNFNVFNK